MPFKTIEEFRMLPKEDQEDLYNCIDCWICPLKPKNFDSCIEAGLYTCCAIKPIEK